MKICTKCKEEKELINFYKDSYKKGGYKTICISCEKIRNHSNIDIKKEAGKIYYINNKEKINKRKKVYYEENKEHLKEYKKMYYEENKEHLNNINKAWYQKNKLYILDKNKKRLKDDNLYHFIQNIKTNIRNSIIRSGYSKKTRTFKILGVDYDTFKNYIESQFKEGMTWDNYGEWHLDHKTPISWGKDEEEVILLCYYTNYQPLWAFENQSKGNRYKS